MMTNNELLEIFRETASSKVFKIAERTLEEYCKSINYLLDFLNNKNILDINKKDIKAYMQSISEVSDSTYNGRLSSYKTLFKVLAYDYRTEDLITTDPTFGIINIKKVQNKKKIPLNKEEQFYLIKFAKNERDKAIISMLLNTGLRIHELVGLTLNQYLNRPDGKIDITINKGSYNDEYIFINEETEKYIDDYIRVRKNTSDKLFVSNQGTEMSRVVVSRMIKNTARRSGQFTEERISELCNHVMRHTMATNMINNDIAIETVAKALRHHGLGTVMTYAKVNEDKIKQAMCG